MSDGSTEGRQGDSGLHETQAERDLVRVEADVVSDASISQAAQRDAAELVARNAAYIQDAVATAQRNAKIRADQERAYASGSGRKSSVLRENLASERKAPSNVTFGVATAFLLLLIGCIAGGVYYFSSQNSAAVGTAPEAVASAASPAKSSDVSSPPQPPITINAHTAPARTKTSAGSGSANGGSDPNNSTGENPSSESRNFSGAALNAKGAGDSGGSNTNTEGNLTLPGSDAATGTGAKSAPP